MLNEEVESELPGVALVEQTGAAVAAWSPDGRRIAIPVPGGIGVAAGIGLRRPGGAILSRFEAPPLSAGWGRPPPVEWLRKGRFLRYVTTSGPNRDHRFWLTVALPDGSGLEQTPLLSEAPAKADQAVLSPDGRLVLFKLPGRGVSELWVANSDGTGARKLAQSLFLRSYRFSPDGEQIAIAAGGVQGGLLVVPTAGGTPRRVVAEMPNEGPTWTPDGRWLTYSDFDGKVIRVHPDGSGAATVADFDGEDVRGLIWSPDGRRLLYSERPFPSPYAD